MRPGDKILAALAILGDVLGPGPLTSDSGPTDCNECEYKTPGMVDASDEGWCYMFEEQVECCCQFRMKGS